MQTRLVYVRGTGAGNCPPQMQLRMAVAARLGYDPFSATAARTVIARIEEKSGELRARVELVDDESASQGARSLTGPAERCSELVRAIALSISIAIDPENAMLAQDNPAPREPNAVLEPTRTARAAVAPPVVSEPDTNRQRASSKASIRVFSGAGLHWTTGAGPSGAPGADWFLGARHGMLSLSLEQLVDSRTSKSAGTGSIHVAFVLGSLVPCLHWGNAMLCGTGSYGMILASASGLTHDSSDTGNYTALGGRVGWETPLLGRLWGGLHAGLFAPWHPIRLKTTENVPLWTAPSVGTSFGFRLSAHY